MPSTTKYFYCRRRLVNALHDQGAQRVLCQGRRPLAEISHLPDGQHARFLRCDAAGSVLGVQPRKGMTAFDYTVYGYAQRKDRASCLLGFNGEHRNAFEDVYLLGQGHRAYSTIMMRFHSPDNISPFGRGGVNAYAYCHGDPVNYTDPSGKSAIGRFLKYIGTAGLRKRKNVTRERYRIKFAGKWLESEVRQYGARLQRDTDIRLKDIAFMEPDVARNVMQHLSPGALQRAFTAPRDHLGQPSPSTEAWLKEMNREGVKEHYEGIMAGNPGNYAADARISREAVNSLAQLEVGLLLTARPYTLRYARNPSAALSADLRLYQANAEIRRILAGTESGYS